MPQAPEFEYGYRWVDIVSNGILNSAHMLNDRDRALEKKLRENCEAVAASIPVQIQAFGTFSHPFDAAEYTFVGSGNLTGFDVSGFGGSGPFLADYELFINGVSFMTTGPMSTSTPELSFSEPVTTGDVLRIEGTVVLGTVTDCIVLVFTDGTETDVTVGWDA